ncbi:MFS transporter, partial [Mitsuokella jalaludinii]|uniref:MFS transporter n=1 Tax=Mitsuokella jalaludinii TaxID=187979 RepID=UPI00307B0DE4
IMLVALLIYAGSGTNVTMALIGAGLFALPQPLIFLVVLMTITDSVEYGQLKIGHRDEAVCLCVRPLVDKFAGAVSSGIIGLVAVWVGVAGGASAADIKPDALFHFQIVMFAAPIVLMVIASFIYRAKVTLTEAEHARIVRELEEKWEDLSK